MKVRKWLLAVVGIICLEGVILTGMFFILPGGKAYGETEYRVGSGVVVLDGGPEDEGKTEEVYDQIEKGTKREKKAQKIYEENKEDLVLVNVDHKLDKEYEASLRSICGGRLQVSDRMYRSLVDMLAAASDAGHQYWIASAWRSREKQQKLVDEDVRKLMDQGMSREKALEETYRETMPAGHSEHETGLALDILCSGNMQMNRLQQGEPGNKWLCKNSWRYGFVLRYPEEKEKITGIRYEPWHFRYVGKKAAAYMKENDLTLEEFWDRVDENVKE